jgi:hypothetical protein
MHNTNSLSVYGFRTFIDGVLVPIVGTRTHVKTLFDFLQSKKDSARSLRNTKGTRIHFLVPTVGTRLRELENIHSKS